VHEQHFVEGTDGKPRLVRNEHVNWASRSTSEGPTAAAPSWCRCIRDADTLDFAGFLAAYEELIRKVKTNKLTVDDFQGATITLTNPGTIGTVQSVPRLMPGQGVIVGVGSIDYPAEFQGADQRTLAELGVSARSSPSLSTYDHRIIQGAESGLFLKRVTSCSWARRLLRRRVPQPRRALRGGAVARRRQPGRRTRDRDAAQADAGGHAHQRAPRARPPHRRSRPAALEGARRCTPELDPATYGLTIWDLDREFLTGTASAGCPAEARRPAPRAARRVLPHDRRRVHAHPGAEEKRWIQARSRGRSTRSSCRRTQRHILERLNAAEAFEKFLATKYVGQKRFGLEGAESPSRSSTQMLTMAADAGIDSAVLGMAHRGRLNVLANIVGKSYDQIFKEFEGHVDPDSVQGSGDVKYHLGQDRHLRQPQRRVHPGSSWPPTRAPRRPSTRS
jgi:2-oxoglutarate decarboxylase